MLWLGVEGAKELLQHSYYNLQEKLVGLGFEKETKYSGFNPHVTLGRIKELPENFSTCFDKHKEVYIAECQLQTLTLYESVFVQEGQYRKVVYKSVAHVEI